MKGLHTNILIQFVSLTVASNTKQWTAPTRNANNLSILASDEGLWILLTDDDDAAVERGSGVRVLEWEGWGEGKGVKEVAGWPSNQEKDGGEAGTWMKGGSHAIWLD